MPSRAHATPTADRGTRSRRPTACSLTPTGTANAERSQYSNIFTKNISSVRTFCRVTAYFTQFAVARCGLPAARLGTAGPTRRYTRVLRLYTRPDRATRPMSDVHTYVPATTTSKSLASSVDTLMHNRGNLLTSNMRAFGPLLAAVQPDGNWY